MQDYGVSASNGYHFNILRGSCEACLLGMAKRKRKACHYLPHKFIDSSGRFFRSARSGVSLAALGMVAYFTEIFIIHA